MFYGFVPMLGVYLLGQPFFHKNWILNLHSKLKWKRTSEKICYRFTFSLFQASTGYLISFSEFEWAGESDITYWGNSPVTWLDQQWHPVNFSLSWDGTGSYDHYSPTSLLSPLHLKTIHAAQHTTGGNTTYHLEHTYASRGHYILT
jgi:hypothetical protein